MTDILRACTVKKLHVKLQFLHVIYVILIYFFYSISKKN